MITVKVEGRNIANLWNLACVHQLTKNNKEGSPCVKVASKMEAGGAVINGASFFRAFEQPFGGWKHSGIGTEGVFSTFDEMTLSKTIVLKNIF